MIVVGGLGGGGDVVAALSLLALHPELVGKDYSIISFLPCSTSWHGSPGERIRGALVVFKKPLPNRRVFEDKLDPVLLGRLVGKGPQHVYGFCVSSGSDDIEDALEYMAGLGIDGMVFADLGGDGLLLGYESNWGTYLEDTLARHIIYSFSRKTGIKSYIAVGLIGGEYGGVIPVWELVADLVWLGEKGALKQVFTLPISTLQVAEPLSRLGESAMLTILLDALRGNYGPKRYDVAYLHTVFNVQPFHRDFFILDSVLHCELSPLCRLAPRLQFIGEKKAKHKIPPPPNELQKLYKKSSSEWPRLLESVRKKYIRRKMAI